MNESEIGGGASPTTEPAAGSSSGTDVPLKEFTGREDYWIDRSASRENWWLDKFLKAEIDSLRRETTAAQDNAKEAVAIANTEASARLEAHNGLIEQMRLQGATFMSRELFDHQVKADDERMKRMENFQSKILGGLGIVTLIGVANLIKIWTG